MGAVTVSECMVHPKTDGSHAYHLDTSILNSLASAPYTAVIGDAAKVSTITNAVYWGYHAALDL